MKNLNYTVCILFILLSSTQLFAQDNYFIGFYRSFPLGAYGKTDLSKDAGFAESGWGILFENKAGLGLFPEGFSLGFHFSFHKNSLNTSNFEGAFREVLGTQYKVDINNHGGGYNPIVITLGPFYQFYFGDEFSLEIKTGLGVMFTNIDPIILKVYDEQGNKLVDELLRFDASPKFTYLIGADFGIYFRRNIRLILFADQSSVSTDVTTSSNNIPGINSTFKISYINVGLGVSWKF